MAKLPEATQEPLLHVDATPDEDYPLRILRVCLSNTQTRWKVEGLSDNVTLLYKTMNKHQEQRAKILQRAISCLEEARQQTKGTP